MVKIKLHDKDKDMVEIYSCNKDGSEYVLWGVISSDILQAMEGISWQDIEEMDFELLAEATNK